MKRVNVKVVHYSPGRPGVSIDVEQEVEEDGAWLVVGQRETVETRQDALPVKWVDADIIKAVEDATVEVEPAVDAIEEMRDADSGEVTREAVAAKAAVLAPRFDGLEVVAE